ncbi:hypothetical protein Llac01_06120 [Leuconostoc lactis]|nr:hypothetical protein LLA04_09350 [Leuconostoc lactis]GLY45235.1 hypothetical protein Llac01_06120 [Leuconostoc lactis]
MLQMSQVFARFGYAGTALDDLVAATGVLRGSLYRAFGSKQEMFIACLTAGLAKQPQSELTWRLILVALLELTQTSTAVRTLIQEWYREQEATTVLAQLGQQLLNQSGILKEALPDGKHS